MDICDVLLESSRFNISEVKPHFINPCCFGEDLAQWLINKLEERGIQARKPYQEDWGWEFSAEEDLNSYYIGVGGNSAEDPANPNRGEWRVMITKRRSLIEKLLGKNRLKQEEPIIRTVWNILEAEPSFSNLHFENGP